MSTHNEYLESLISKLSGSFNIIRDTEYFRLNFDLHAALNIKNTKFAVIKDIKIYEFENNEHFLIKTASLFDTKSIETEYIALKRNIKEIVKPHSDHMSSQVLLVYISEERIPEDLAKLASRSKSQKGFSFGFKGWADIALVVVSLKENRVITDKKIMKTASFFEPEKVLKRRKS